MPDPNGHLAGKRAHELAAEALAAHGVDFAFVAVKLKRLARANNQKVFCNSQTGQIYYSKKMKAHSVRLQSIDMINKILGSYAPKKIEDESNTVPVTIKLVAPRGTEMKVRPPERKD